MNDDPVFRQVRETIFAMCEDRRPSDEVIRLLSFSLLRVLAKEARRGNDWRLLADTDKVIHICDWLQASINDNRPWLSRLDASGRPKKLLKYPTVAAILAEADRDMLAFAQKVGKIQIKDGDEELWMELEGGYALVRLLTSTALDHESAVMQHCIGQGGYDQYLKTGEHFFLSLRDSSNKAHATLEVERDGLIIQLQGKQNRKPLRRYVEILLKAFRDPRLDPKNVLTKLDIVMSTDGQFLDKYALPAGTTLAGGLDLGWHGSEEAWDFSLPDNLTVPDQFFIHTDRIARLPSGLCVRGRFTVKSGAIKSIPADLTVIGVAEFSDMEIEDFPDDMVFEGNLILHKVAIRKFPSRLWVRGDLIVSECDFSVIPVGLRVDGRIVLKQCNVGAFAAGFKTNGHLELEFSTVASLPEDLEVGGDLDLSFATVEHIPERASVHGTLNVCLATFDRLPATWMVGGSIEAGGSTLSELPGRTAVHGNLVLADSQVTSISGVLEVKGDLSISSTAISALPANIVIGGDLDAKGSSLAALPEGMSLGGRLLLAHSKVDRLPQGLSVAGACDLADTAISELPAGFSCAGYLDLVSTEVRDIPDNCHIDQLICADLPHSIGDAVGVPKGIIVMGRGEIFSLDDMRRMIAERQAAVAA
jgi:hypothetical protein